MYKILIALFFCANILAIPTEGYAQRESDNTDYHPFKTDDFSNDGFPFYGGSYSSTDYYPMYGSTDYDPHIYDDTRFDVNPAGYHGGAFGGGGFYGSYQGHH